MKLDEIFKAWLKTASPTEIQKEIAKERLNVCNGCPSKQKGVGKLFVCGECNCPISYGDKPVGKTYTEQNECPLHKWKR